MGLQRGKFFCSGLLNKQDIERQYSVLITKNTKLNKIPTIKKMTPFCAGNTRMHIPALSLRFPRFPSLAFLSHIVSTCLFHLF